MKPEARIAVLEFSFFLLLASIITFALIGWRELALLFSAVLAISGRIALNYYYECVAGCGPLSAKISAIPIIVFVASALFLISFRRHPFLVAALFMLLFVLIIWKIALLLKWIDYESLKKDRD